MHFNKGLYLTLFSVLLNIASYGQNGKIDSLENILKQQVKEDTNRVKTLNNLAYYYNGNDQYKLKKCAVQALALSLKLRYQRGEARAYIALGHMYINDNADPRALEYLNKAAVIYQSLNDRARYSGVLSGIGIYYSSIRDYELAMTYDQMAFDAIKGFKTGIREVNCLSNIGDDYEKLGQYEKAHQYYNQALGLALNIGDKEILPFCYLNIAFVHLKEKKYQAALYYCKKVRNAQKSRNSTSAKEAAQVSLVEAQIYLGLNDYDRAEKRLNLSDSITSRTRVLETRLKIYHVRYLLDSATHRSDAALHQSYLYHQLSDSVINVNKNRVSALFNFRIESQRHEAENQRLRIVADKNKSIISRQYIIGVILITGLIVIGFSLIYFKRLYEQIRIKNNIINEQNHTLENTNMVKDKLFSVIAHDLRSPITQMLNVVNAWQSGDIEQEEVSQLSPMIKAGIINTLELLDNLLIWCRNQLQGFNFEPVKFSVYSLVTENMKDLESQFIQKGITSINLVKPESELYTDREMLRIVLRNLLSNSIKFTPNGGSISVSSYVVIEGLVILVEDTGIGIKKVDLHKVFSSTIHTTLGTANEKGTGIGLKICQEFIELSKGKIWVDSEEGIGSRFYISLPI